MIHVSNLVYEYPGKRALDAISFTAQKGRILAVVGPNGAGKTTLFKCLTTLIKPMNGRVCIDGIDVALNPRQARSIVGYLPDEFGLYETLTVRESLSYFAQAYGVEKSIINNRVIETVGQLDLSEKIDSRCRDLSRGMRQRVAIGQAMIHRPRVLILDEPASGLDPEARHELSLLFIALKEKGVTLVVSSHILSELDEYADDLIILKKGAIVSGGGHENSDSSVVRLVIELDSGSGAAMELLGVNRFLPHRYEARELEALSRVSDVEQQHQSVRFQFSGTNDERSVLLKMLLEQGCVIKEFFEEKQSMQDTYLTKVRG